MQLQKMKRRRASGINSNDSSVTFSASFRPWWRWCCMAVLWIAMTTTTTTTTTTAFPTTDAFTATKSFISSSSSSSAYRKSNHFISTTTTTSHPLRKLSLPLLHAVLEQQSEDTSSSSSSAAARTTASSAYSSTGSSTGSSSYQDWIRWEQDLVQLGRQGRTDEALQLFDTLMKSTTTATTATTRKTSSSSSLPPLSTRVRWWNAALDACARARPTRCDDAMALFHRGIQQQQPTPHQQPTSSSSSASAPLFLQPNVFTFGILTSACARARRADLAIDLLRNMETQYGVTPNAVVYSTVISACARAQPQPLLATAIDLLREATMERRLAMNVVGYNAVLAACANAGDWQQAMDILEHMEQQQQQQQEALLSTTTASSSSSSYSLPLPPPPDMVTYGTVMAACERGEQWELVLTCAKRATRQFPNGMDGLALTSALHACQQLGLAQEALQYLQLMKLQQSQQSQTQSPLNRQAQYYYIPVDRKTAGWQRQGVKQPLRGPDAVAYRLAISACARGGEWQEGLKLLDELRALDIDTTNTANSNARSSSSNAVAGGGSGSGPRGGADVVAYTAAMNGCEYAGEWQNALILLDKMRKDGVQPNEVTMASVFGACATACAKMFVATTSTNPTTVSAAPSASSSSIISNSGGSLLGLNGGGGNNNQVVMLPPQKKALQLLQVMKKDDTLVRPNIVVYNAAIRVCAEAGDVSRAFGLLEDLRLEGLQATVVTYGSLMTACERVGSVDGASKVFRRMKDDGLEPNEIIYGAAISCCRKAHEPERAMLLLRKMIREGLSPNVATFHTVLVAQTEASRTKEVGHHSFNNNNSNNKGDLERAVLVYKLMKSPKYSSDESRPNRQTYHLLIRALASRRYPQEAEFLLHQMQKDGMTPDVDLYTATVTAYERTGQPLQALRLMESMREDGYDFYEVKVLNEAFKKAINLVHVVGKGLSSSSSSSSSSNTAESEAKSSVSYQFGLGDDEDEVDESFSKGRS